MEQKLGLTATILIQVGADEPKPIGTIQIPIKMTLADPEPPIGLLGTPGARGGRIPPVELEINEMPEGWAVGRMREATP